jgi:hypothetical protein
MQERMRDLRWPVLVAIVVVAAMLAAFTVSRSDAAPAAQNAVPNQTVQSESTPQPAPDQDGDGRDCPEKDGRGRGGSGAGGSAPAPEQTTPTSPGTDL